MRSDVRPAASAEVGAPIWSATTRSSVALGDQTQHGRCAKLPPRAA
jgi:hypothetical protein